MWIDISSQQKSPTLLPMSDYTFDQLLKDRRAELRLSGPELEAKAKVSRQVISAIERQAPHPVTKAPYRPGRKTVDKLAAALGVPLAEAREAAGFAAGALPSETPVDIEVQRLARYFKELPRECQLDVLALTEALWRRRRDGKRRDGRSSKSSGKHRPETTTPGVERPAPKRKAS